VTCERPNLIERHSESEIPGAVVEVCMPRRQPSKAVAASRDQICTAQTCHAVQRHAVASKR
jgi:hypothetical protein